MTLLAAGLQLPQEVLTLLFDGILDLINVAPGATALRFQLGELLRRLLLRGHGFITLGQSRSTATEFVEFFCE